MSEPLAPLGRAFAAAPDTAAFYRSRTQARALETLTFGLRRRERFLLVTGAPGTGKTVLCRALLDSLRPTRAVSFIGDSAVSTPHALYRRLLEDFASADEGTAPAATSATSCDLRDCVLSVLATLSRRRGGPVVVVDDAHALPEAVVEELLRLTAAETASEQPLQIVLVGRASADGSGVLGVRALDELISTRTRLTTLSRDECERYVRHRLVAAGGNPDLFTPRAIGVLHSLSGGIPRLLNLIAERALVLTQGQGAQQVDSGDVAAVASSLDALAARPRRFRWFARHAS